jgi:surface antigen
MMSSLFGIKPRSFKLELGIVLGVILTLLTLPVVALFSVTNVSALINSESDDKTGNAMLYTDSAYPGDLYDYGNCTYWAAMRRAQVAEPIPNTWGNAATWAARALLSGYTVDHTPSQYAIMQTPDAAGGLGHVAFVEKVDPDGIWHISEMNVVGFDEIDYKALPPQAAAKYSFIHE